MCMTYFEQKISEYEQRPAAFSVGEQAQRFERIKTISDINRFEGISPSDKHKRLYPLLAAGKITKKEYLELCLIDAKGDYM